MRGSTSIRILVVDDQRIVRQGIRALLAGKPGLEVIGEADCGEAAVRLAERLQPSVVLMDLMMPGIGGSRQSTASCGEVWTPVSSC